MRKTQRLISFILAMVLTLTSINLVSADSDTNTSGSGGTGSGGEDSSTNSGDDITAGFKVELLWLDLDEEVYSMKPSDEKDALVEQAFNNAKNDYSDTAHTGAVIQHIGNPLYLTSNEIASASGNLTAEAYPYGDSVYGLGDREGQTGIERGDKRPKPATLESISAIKSKAASLTYNNSTLGSVIGNYTSGYGDLPIFMGNKSNVSSGSGYDQYWQDYFTAFRPANTKTEYTGDYVARPTLCALVNYISTKAGEVPTDAIYFKDVYVNNGIMQPGMPESAGDYRPNCYDTGIWKGQTGVYKIIFSQIYRINADGYGSMFLTGRDYIYVAEQQAESLGVDVTSTSTIIGWQPVMFPQLIKNFSLAHNDIWGLQKAPVGTSWGSLGNIVSNIKNKHLGGGLSTFSSLDTSAEPDSPSTPNYIGSITNVFLPNSLNKDDSSIKTASLEYIGPKSGGTNDSTTTALENASIQIAKAMSGETVLGSDNIYTNKDLTNQSILLNGTIKLPGIQEDNTSATGLQATQGYAERYMSELRALIDGTGEGTLDLDQPTRDSIKRLLLEELGIDLEEPGTTEIRLTDLSLAMYVLSHYQLDGVEANGTGYEVYNSPANRWKMILAYQGMLENDKSAKAIDTSSEDGGAWAGPLSITASDIENYDTNKGFNTVPLKNDDTSKLKGYPQTSEGASKAIEEGVLDNTQTGQISVQTNSQSVWKEMLGAGDLDSGLVRVPIAMGTTQMHLMTGDDKSFNLQKAQLGQIQADVLKGLVSACFDENGYLIALFFCLFADVGDLLQF